MLPMTARNSLRCAIKSLRSRANSLLSDVKFPCFDTGIFGENHAKSMVCVEFAGCGERLFPCRQGNRRKAAPLEAAPSPPAPLPHAGEGMAVWYLSSAVPAELLRLPGRALAELDVDQARAGEVHQLVERAAEVLGVLDIGAVAAEGLHHLVVSAAVDQLVRPHVYHPLPHDFRNPHPSPSTF